jgi:hypothetical protein
LECVYPFLDTTVLTCVCNFEKHSQLVCVDIQSAEHVRTDITETGNVSGETLLTHVETTVYSLYKALSYSLIYNIACGCRIVANCIEI